MELKKPTTFEQQAELLQNKNIIIEDKNSCISFLSHVNYYRLSGYYLPFIKKEEEACFIPISFEQIKNIYIFDAELRNLMLRSLEKIEIHIRTHLAYYHAHNYGPEGYMRRSNFNKFHNHEAFLKRVQSCINENKNSLVIKHHKEHYDDHFPIWVIIDYFSMGMLSYFYRGMKNHDKATIAQKLYGVNYQILESWLRCVTDLRNRCAHYSRIYYWIFPALPKMPADINYIPTRRLFAQLYMLKFLYPEPDKWNPEFVHPLEKLIQKYNPYISKKHLDFPYRWKSMLKK